MRCPLATRALSRRLKPARSSRGMRSAWARSRAVAGCLMLSRIAVSRSSDESMSTDLSGPFVSLLLIVKRLKASGEQSRGISWLVNLSGVGPRRKAGDHVELAEELADDLVGIAGDAQAVNLRH